MKADLPFCPVTGKVSFKNARSARSLQRYTSRRKTKFMQAYPCPHCPYYHVSKGKNARLKTKPKAAP